MKQLMLGLAVVLLAFFCMSSVAGAQDCQEVAPGTLCDDGNPCTPTSECSGGACVATSSSPNGTKCEDPLFCNGSETCQSGFCTAGVSVCPPSGNACLQAICDEELQVCVEIPVTCVPQNDCYDAVCDVQTGSCVETLLPCNPFDSCHTASCSPSNGCQQISLVCTPPTACHEASCDVVNGCVATSIVCDDVDLCHAGSCDEITGCEQTYLCTAQESCTATGCAATVPAIGATGIVILVLMMLASLGWITSRGFKLG